MNWSEESNTEEKKKMQPKLGRRNQSSEDFGSTDDILENTSEQNVTQAPVRAKRAGGWADETLKSGKSKNATNLIEQERFREQSISLDDDIPVIPDIEEIQDDTSNDIARAPSIAVNRVSAYKELNKDLLKQNSFNQFGEINLSHLTRFIYPEKDIRESDVPWTKESLFNELITEYRGSVNETK